MVSISTHILAEMETSVARMSDTIAQESAEVIAAYWLAFIAIRYKQQTRGQFNDSLVRAWTSEPWSVWEGRQSDAMTEVDRLRHSVTLAKHTFFMARADLDPSTSKAMKSAVVIAKAGAHYSGVGDTNAAALDSILEELLRLEAVCEDNVKTACDSVPVTHYSESIRTGGCLLTGCISGITLIVIALGSYKLVHLIG